MKKFVLSIVAFSIGSIGTLLCMLNSLEIESIYTRTGLYDSMATYEYTTNPLVLVGVIIFFLMAILGLLFAIKYAKLSQNDQISG